jgi:hypothetical protein
MLSPASGKLKLARRNMVAVIAPRDEHGVQLERF